MRIGYYRDTYVRTDDGWRLKTRAMTFIRRSGDHDSAAPTRSAGPRLHERLSGHSDDSGVPVAAGGLARRERPDATARRPLAGRAPSRNSPGCCARCTTPAGCGTAGRSKPAGSAARRCLRAIVGEEVVGRGLAEPGPYSMVEVLTPTMIDYARPRTRRARWCRGFCRAAKHGVRASQSPGSGSDLASLSTRADPARRRLDRQRAEGLDELRAVLGPLRPAHPHRRRGPPPTTKPSPRSSSTWTRRASQSGRCARCTGSTSSARCTSTTCVIPGDRMLGKPGDGWQLAMDLLPYERSTCFWQRIAYLYSRFDRLIAEAVDEVDPTPTSIGRGVPGAAHAALPSRSHQHRLADGTRLGPETSIDKVLLATAEQTAVRHRARSAARRDRTRRHTVAHRIPLLARGDDLRRHRRNSAQHHRAPAARSREGVIVDAVAFG